MSSAYEIALTYKVDNSCRDIPSLRKKRAGYLEAVTPAAEQTAILDIPHRGRVMPPKILQIALVWLALCVSSQGPPSSTSMERCQRACLNMSGMLPIALRGLARLRDSSTFDQRRIVTTTLSGVH